MKLIDILVEELTSRGGWPVDSEYAWADPDGEIRFPCTCGDFYPENKVEFHDRNVGIGISVIRVTRVQYEAALADKNDGWITWGGGKCPVDGDTIVDARYSMTSKIIARKASDFDWVNRYRPFITHYRLHNPEEVKSEWNGEGIPPIGSMVEIIDHDGMLVYGHGESGEVIAHVEKTAVVRMSYGLGCFDAGFLKPLRTEADRKRDEAVKAIAKAGGADVDDSFGKQTKIGIIGSSWFDVYDAIAAGKIPGVKLEG